MEVPLSVNRKHVNHGIIAYGIYAYFQKFIPKLIMIKCTTESDNVLRVLICLTCDDTIVLVICLMLQ